MFKSRHFDQSIILLRVRWYLAYGLSLRDLKEMISERGISVDHSTNHRWIVHFSPYKCETMCLKKLIYRGEAFQGGEQIESVRR